MRTCQLGKKKRHWCFTQSLNWANSMKHVINAAFVRAGIKSRTRLCFSFTAELVSRASFCPRMPAVTHLCPLHKKKVGVLM